MHQPWATELRFVGGTSAELHVHWPRLGRAAAHSCHPSGSPTGARETKALLANPSAHLAVAKLRRLRRYYARSLKLVKATPMPDGERVRRELAETVAAIDDALVKCLRRR